jgi:hypothetical protein
MSPEKLAFGLTKKKRSLLLFSVELFAAQRTSSKVESVCKHRCKKT